MWYPVPLPCCLTMSAGPVPLLDKSICSVTRTIVSVLMKSPVKLIEPSTVRFFFTWTLLSKVPFDFTNIVPSIVAFVSTFRSPPTLTPPLNEASPTVVKLLFKVVAPPTDNTWFNEASFWAVNLPVTVAACCTLRLPLTLTWALNEASPVLSIIIRWEPAV